MSYREITIPGTVVIGRTVYIYIYIVDNGLYTKLTCNSGSHGHEHEAVTISCAMRESSLRLGCVSWHDHETNDRPFRPDKGTVTSLSWNIEL